MTVKILQIKLENFFRYGGNDGKITVASDQLRDLITDFCSTAGTADKRFVFSMAPEPHGMARLDEVLFPMLDAEMASRGIGDWLVVIGNTFEVTVRYGIRNLRPENYLYMDFLALKTLFRCKLPGQVTSDEWNRFSGKALLLTGKAHVPNRIGLIGRFYDLGAMDRLVWSLHMSDELVARCRSMFPHYTDDRYMEFLDKCKRNPDHALVEMRGDSSHYEGFPYDPALYSETSFSIVSESFYSVPWYIITEKTYRPIMNMHPFVMAGPPGNVAFLESIGFDTFRKHLPIPDYDSIANHAKRLDAIVDNCMAFYDIIRDNPDEIYEGVIHNRFNLLARCQMELDRLRSRIDGGAKDETLFDLMKGF